MVPDARGSALRQLRCGDYRQAVVVASGRERTVEQATAIPIAADVMWRNAVKYQAREYLHAFWGRGTILANTLAIAAAHRLPAKIVTGFVDDLVSRLLDLNPRHEQALALIPIGAAPSASHPAAPPIDALKLAVQPVSDREIDQPAIRCDACRIGVAHARPRGNVAQRDAAPSPAALRFAYSA